METGFSSIGDYAIMATTPSLWGLVGKETGDKTERLRPTVPYLNFLKNRNLFFLISKTLGEKSLAALTASPNSLLKN